MKKQINTKQPWQFNLSFLRHSQRHLLITNDQKVISHFGQFLAQELELYLFRKGEKSSANSILQDLPLIKSLKRGIVKIYVVYKLDPGKFLNQRKQFSFHVDITLHQIQTKCKLLGLLFSLLCFSLFKFQKQNITEKVNKGRINSQLGIKISHTYFLV